MPIQFSSTTASRFCFFPPRAQLPGDQQGAPKGEEWRVTHWTSSIPARLKKNTGGTSSEAGRGPGPPAAIRGHCGMALLSRQKARSREPGPGAASALTAAAGDPRGFEVLSSRQGTRVAGGDLRGTWLRHGEGWGRFLQPGSQVEGAAQPAAPTGPRFPTIPEVGSILLL